MYDLTVVIPTLNERGNVLPLYDLVSKALAGIEWEALFVDDNSPDGTASVVRSLARDVHNVRLLRRVRRSGLAGACIEGIQSSKAQFCAVIDADMQHDEACLPVMLDLLRADPGLDIVIGTRNAQGGSKGFGLSRIRDWGSTAATTLARRVLGVTTSDPMSGFFMVRRSSFDRVAPELQTAGFKILLDMLSASRGQWKLAEVPFVFRPRQFGRSKMNLAVVAEFISLLVARLSDGLLSMRFILYMMVGLSGVVVQLLVVWLVISLLPGAITVAQSIGVFAAINTNFAFNNLLTYRDRRLVRRQLFYGVLSYYGVCAMGALASIGTATLVYAILPVWALASLSGAAAGALWNYFASARLTWRDS